MIPQQAIQKEAYKRFPITGAHDSLTPTLFEKFTQGAAWVNQQYRPLMEALERAIEHAEFGKISVDNTIALMQALQKLKQHT